MISAAEIDALVAAGATPEMLAAVVKAGLLEEEAKKTAKRAKDAERQRRHRESRNVTVTDCDSALQKKEKNQKKENIYTPLEIPSVSLSPQVQKPTEKSLLANFGLFWEVFPRRVAKGGALKAFRAALKRGATVEEILVGAKRYAEQRKGEDKQFTCMPATWLNQDRWLDEPTASVEGNPFAFRSSGPKRTWAEIKAERLAKAGGKTAQVIDFPGVKIQKAPVEGEDLDALVCSDDQSSQGSFGQEEPGASGLFNILPALQAMDASKEDQT